MASIVSMLFSFVLILYSVSNFLRNRSKQFAILNIIGASKGQFNKLIFFENIIISIFALLVGIITGIIFSKIFLMIAQSMINGLNLYFYFPLIPLLLTVFLMGGLFLLISLISPVILRKKRIIDLLKKEELAEKNYFLLSLAAVIVILSPTIYFHIKKEFFTFIYILDLLSCISTSYFIFNLIFNVYNFFMEKSGRIYVNNNLIKLSNFKYKVNTNIKTMAATMILFSIILTAFVYIVGAPMNVTEDTEKIMPYSYMYANWEDEAEGERKAKLIADELKSADGFKKLTISYSELKNKARTVRHIILSNTMYNEVADFLNRKKINLSDNEYFLVGVDGKSKPILPDVVKNEISGHGITKEIGTDKRIISMSGYFTSVTVISDRSYESISSALVKDRIYAFTQSNLTNGGSEDLANIKKLIGFEEGKESLISYIFYYDIENLTRRLVSYVGSILCISFLIGIASIIYSRLYSSVEEESKKYSIMIKMGLSKDELKDILASTLRWLFILPFMTSLIISWIIISIVNQMIVTSYTNLTIICSFIYLLTEFILYMTIKRKYQEKILNNI
ncbi:ABC transporter permease [Lachnoanaerobaculum saburreum]|nr:ABC transporter permease [Lachnoanaerobaculum saburreum]